MDAQPGTQSTMKILSTYSLFIKQVLCSLAVLFFLFNFFVLPFISLYAFATLCFSSYWYLAVLYTCWYWYDFDTPINGGRKFQPLRKLQTWKFLKAFFPINLHKTAELSSEHNYILCYHPHGIPVFGAFINFVTDSGGFRQLFPNIRLRCMILFVFFYLPLFREWALLAGLCSCDRRTYKYLTTQKDKGSAALVVPGGAEEALDCNSKSMDLILSTRHGFTKLALSTGAHLVPVISFGENELYQQIDNPRGSKLRKLQNWLMKYIQFSPPIFWGASVFFPLFPRKIAIDTVVGAPIPVPHKPNPTWEEVCDLHNEYISHLKDLFEKSKTRFGYPEDYQLVIH